MSAFATDHSHKEFRHVYAMVFAIGQALVKKGVLDKQDILDQLDAYSFNKSEEVSSEIIEMKSIVNTW